LKNPSFKALFDLLSRSEDDSLAIPQLVMDEAINNFKEAITKIQSALKSQSREFQLWTGEELLPPGTNDKVQKTIAKYEQDLKDTLLQAGTIIRSYPATSHEQLVTKCLSRKRPFSEDGKEGYRDALIWESILEILVESAPEKVAFITNNSNDFFEKNKQALHHHMIEDLLQREIEVNRVDVFKNLHYFVDAYIKPKMETLNVEVIESIRSDLSFGLGRHDKQEIEAGIFQALRTYDYGDGIESYEVGLPPEAESITVSYVEDFSDLHTIDGRKLSSGDWFIEATAIIRYQFDFFIYKADRYAMGEEASIEVIDSDWNDHYICAQTTKPVQVSFTLTFDEPTGNVTSIEVNTFASVFQDQ
jgi:PIN domain